jgi:hypothetical protein
VYVPLVLTLRNPTFRPQIIYMFRIYLRKKQWSLYNWGDNCSLRGTNWVFQENGSDFVLKWLSTETSLSSLQFPYLHFVQLRQHLDNDKQISSSLWQQLCESVVLICMRCRGLEIVEFILPPSNYIETAASCIYFVAADCSYMISRYVYM